MTRRPTRRTWREPTTHKYQAVAVTVDGVRFPSKGQARRYRQLKLMQEAGAITKLTLDPWFPIIINGETVCTVIADFSYYVADDPEPTIEDFKGMRTPIYKLKRKLVHACYGVTIVESTAQTMKGHWPVPDGPERDRLAAIQATVEGR